MDIKYLFEPRGIAVIGASENPAKIGHTIVANIVSGGYKGKVYPINPKGGEICGFPAYKSIEDVKGTPDMAVVVVPEKGVFDAIGPCAKAGVQFLSIITSGFSEVGNIEEEKRIIKFANDNGMRVLGPNIFGIYSAKVSLNATFGPRDILAGNVAIITQSGALGIAMIGKTAVENIGLSSIVSVGNKADIDENELIEYLVADKETKVILMYIEGVKHGEKLVETLKDATRKKPVVVIKSGRSRRGAMAAASHTGSLAGADNVFDAIMRQCGVLRAESIDEAFSWARFLANSPMPRSGGAVIVTNGGGVGVMATDACEKFDIRLYDDANRLKTVFAPVTPDFGSTKNPVDLTGGASPKSYSAALSAAFKEKNIDSVISLYCETAVFDMNEMPQMIEGAHKESLKSGKPVVFSLLGGAKVDSCVGALRVKGVAVYDDVYNAVSCLGALFRQKKYLQEVETEVADRQLDATLVEKVVDGARKDGRSFLLIDECRRIMEVAGISMPKSRIVKTIDEAVKFAEQIKYPVVLKIVSRDILHKSDCGGVALDIQNKSELIDAFQAVMQSCRNAYPNAHIEGLDVCEMVLQGTETIIGARVDPSFGPTVMFGLGGIYVEVMKDVSFRAAAISVKDAFAMIKEIKSYPLLLGVRGEKRKDIEGVADVIVKLSNIIRKCKGITDIEINPLVVYEHGDGVKAVDVRVMIK